MSFSNTDDLYKAIRCMFEDVIENDLDNEAKEIESQEITTRILERYHPKRYKRRSTGGIEDINNMKTYSYYHNDRICLKIVNETKRNPPNNRYIYDNNYNLFEAFEYGYDYYEFPVAKKKRKVKNYKYLKPVKLHKEIQRRINSSGEMDKRFKSEMINKGVKFIK